MPVHFAPLGWLLTQFTKGVSLIKSGQEVGRWIAKVSWLIPATRRGHFREIKRRVRPMPFIYKDTDFNLDIDLNVATDYVPAILTPLHLTTLNRHVDAGSEVSEGGLGEVLAADEEREHQTVARILLRGRNRALVLGTAGIGKSTLLRRAAFERTVQAAGAFTDDLFESARELIPFFVPLKVVRITESPPILRFLLASYPYLRGPFGLSRLVGLAKKGRLFIALDGYDEAMLSESYGQTLKHELNAIFARDIPESADEERLRQFYYYLRDCTIWLSSRTDFYANNRLSVGDTHGGTLAYDLWLREAYLAVAHRSTIPQPVEVALPAVEIVGIQKIDSLVDHILEKYKKRKPDVYTSLSLKGFYQWADSAFDAETIRLQSNPLFLTIMCYLHAKGLASQTGTTAERSSETRRSSLRELVSSCVNTLLHDLDEHRVRGLDMVAPGLDYRLSHYTEKREFLEHFAARLFYDERFTGHQVFTREELREIALELAKREGWSPEMVAAVAKRKRTSVVEVLISQGLFVVVERSAGRQAYDFPHQRFREVLAVEYLDNPERVVWALQNVGDRRFGELLKVFFSLSNSYQHVLLEKVLERVDEQDDDGYFARLAAALLEGKPDYYDPQLLLTEWVRSLAGGGRPLDLPDELAKYCHLDQELSAFLPAEILTRAINNDSREARRIGTILSKIDLDLFASTLRRLFVLDHPGARRVAYDLASNRDPRLFFSLLVESRGSARHDEMCEYIVAQENSSPHFWGLATDAMSSEELDHVLARIGETRQNLTNMIRLAQRRRVILQKLQNYFRANLDTFDVQNAPRTETGLHRVVLKRLGVNCELKVLFGFSVEVRGLAEELLRSQVAWHLLTSRTAQLSLQVGGTQPLEYHQADRFAVLCRGVRQYLRREFQCEPEEELGNGFEFGYYRFDTDQIYEISVDDATLDLLPEEDIAQWCEGKGLLNRIQELRRNRTLFVLETAGLRLS